MRTLLVVYIGLFAACGSGNHLLWGEVEADAGPFHIRVTDCYRTRVEPPREEPGHTYRFAPCKDAVILIRDNILTVNGRVEGRVQPGATILVDHGRVAIRNL